MHIVVVVAHPDEESLRFGGTIVKHVRAGHKATIITLTRGGMGHASMPIPQLRATRVREISKAAGILGADVVVMEDFEDQWIPADPLAVARTLIDPLRALKPDVLLCHDPTVLPCDQSNTARGVLVAATRIYFPLLKTEHPSVPIPDIYHLPEMNQRPDIYIDITDVMDVRLAAMRCQQTQIFWARDLYWDAAPQDIKGMDDAAAEEAWIQQQLRTEVAYGAKCGAEYAEAYVAFRSPLRMARSTFPTREEITAS